MIQGPSQKLAFLGLAADLKAKNQKFLDKYTFKGVRKLFCQKHFLIRGPSQKLAFLGLPADLKQKIKNYWIGIHLRGLGKFFVKNIF